MMLYVLYCLIILVLTILDQISKYLIVNNFELNKPLVIIENFFDINYIQNFGAGFSILQDQKIFLSVVAIIAICILGYLLINEKNDTKLNKCAYLLIMSGALGNLIDRIRLGYVVDFLDFVIFGYDFPVFNVADCFITIGSFIIIISILVENKHARN